MTEYIGQLEGEVQGKVNECNDLKMQNRALIEENARFRTLAEKLLAHAAFRPFLEELSHDPELAHSLSQISSSNHATPTPAPQSKKDVDPYHQNTQQFSQQHQHVGMTMIPETQLDFSTLNLGGNQWAMPSNGMGNYLQPQVFAVHEVPEPAEPIDVAALSGKDSIIDEFTSSDSKIECPTEIEVPALSEEAPVEEPKQMVCQFDENDPAFTLFATSSSAPSEPVTVKQSIEALAAEIPCEKAAYFELITSSETSNIYAALNLEKNIARMEVACSKLDALFSSFGL
jgi:hypothetical protein